MDVTSNAFTPFTNFPKYVTDETLKRARVDTEDGSAIRVTSTNTVDLTPVTNSLGATQDTSSDPTVIGLLKSISSKLQ